MDETQLVDDGSLEEPETVTLEPSPPPEQASESPPRRDATKLLLGLITALLVGILVVQFLQLQRTTGLEDEVAALTEDVTDLKPLRRDVDILGDQLAALDSQIVAGANSGSSSASNTAQGTDGSLPVLENPSNDPAVLTGMTLATISGPEYYSGSDVAYAPEDGKARVWLVWAHWCPYCQAELPDLHVWWPENATRFPNVELVTVTSAIDDSRSNPLEPYLDAEQFSFPVVVDESGAVSRLFGTAAFPFWVVTDADGTVMFRVAGALGIEAIDEIFTQLEAMSSEA
jgi:thiol-disulfide isomerase/thioredoxin